MYDGPIGYGVNPNRVYNDDGSFTEDPHEDDDKKYPNDIESYH